MCRPRSAAKVDLALAYAVASYRRGCLFLTQMDWKIFHTRTHGQPEKADAGGCDLFVCHRYGHLLHPNCGAIRGF